MIISTVDAASRAGWETSAAPASDGPMVSREAAQAHAGPLDGNQRSGDAASACAREKPAREQAVSNAAQTVAQLVSLTARNPDLAGELEDGLMAARAKLDQAAVDLLASRLDASAMNPGSYAEYRMDVLRIGAELVAQSAADPVALAALGRAMQAMRVPDYLHEQLDIARVDFSAYAILQSARNQPVDPLVVAEKETEIARLEALVAEAQATAQPCDSGTTTDTHGGRVGIDPTASH